MSMAWTDINRSSKPDCFPALAMHKLAALILQQWEYASDRKQVINHLVTTLGHQIFSVALTSVEIWQGIQAELTEMSDQRLPAFNFIEPMPSNASVFARRFLALPAELVLLILSFYNLAELRIVGDSVPFLHSQCAGIERSFISQSFENRGLSWQSIRFMLSQSKAIMGGKFVYDMLSVNPRIMHSAGPIDVFVREGDMAYNVVRYFQIAALYKEHESQASSDVGILHSIQLRHPLGFVVIVHLCKDDPRITIFRTQCHLLWLSGHEYFVAYPLSTLNGRTPCLPWIADSVDARNVAEANARRNDVKLDPNHECVMINSSDAPKCMFISDGSCPFSLRHTLDRYSLRIRHANDGWPLLRKQIYLSYLMRSTAYTLPQSLQHVDVICSRDSFYTCRLLPPPTHRKTNLTVAFTMGKRKHTPTKCSASVSSASDGEHKTVLKISRYQLTYASTAKDEKANFETDPFWNALGSTEGTYFGMWAVRCLKVNNNVDRADAESALRVGLHSFRRFGTQRLALSRLDTNMTVREDITAFIVGVSILVDLARDEDEEWAEFDWPPISVRTAFVGRTVEWPWCVGTPSEKELADAEPLYRVVSLQEDVVGPSRKKKTKLTASASSAGETCSGISADEDAISSDDKDI
ncbi:hypothetical protein B0H12DRAFT_1077377 [Mycena haematopus]|nr:hypothetical protein B0H12DRAFT_1077377 [Mycena haematopus]